MSDELGPVYDWLVTDLHYPFDLYTDLPAWLDVERLARRWKEHEQDPEPVGYWVDAICAETGWTLPN